MFWYIKHKTLNTDIWSDLKHGTKAKKNSRNVKLKPPVGGSESFNKWVIASEPNHLNDWFIQERISVMLLRDTKQCCSCSHFCWWNRAKTGNMVSKTQVS